MARRSDLDAMKQYAGTKGLRIAYESGKAFLFEDEKDPKQKAWVAKSQTKEDADGEMLIRLDVLRSKFPAMLPVVQV